MKPKLYLINGVTVTGNIIKQVNGSILFKVESFTNSSISKNDEGFRKQMRKIIGRTCNPCFIPLLQIAEKS